MPTPTKIKHPKQIAIGIAATSDPLQALVEALLNTVAARNHGINFDPDILDDDQRALADAHDAYQDDMAADYPDDDERSGGLAPLPDTCPACVAIKRERAADLRRWTMARLDATREDAASLDTMAGMLGDILGART